MARAVRSVFVIAGFAATISYSPADAQVSREVNGKTGSTSALNLAGRWSSAPFANNANQQIVSIMDIIQQGRDVTLVLILERYGKPNLVAMEGHIEDGKRIVGRLRGPSESVDNPNWVPGSSTIIDATHIKDDNTGLILEKTAGPEAVTARLPATPAKPYFRAEPFDLNGTWQGIDEKGPPSLYRVEIVEKNGDLTMRNLTVSGPFFRARYTSNPTISGQGIARNSPLDKLKWVEKSLFIEDPDRISYNSEGQNFRYYRLTNPPPHDLVCDDQNSNHVKRSYAWARGRMANAGHDIKSATCWLTISANAGYAQAQSLLAALLLQQSSPAEADYQKAFQLATKSAGQGDIGGQLELASLYREGKGTPQDEQKAQFWIQRAQQSKMAAQWKLWNTKVFLGLTPLDVAGLALKAALAADEDSKKSAMGFLCGNANAEACWGR